MTVSVIVPTFNGERWIGDQLAALAEQTYAGVWELIVADNGSTDDTAPSQRSGLTAFPDFNSSTRPGCADNRTLATRERVKHQVTFSCSRTRTMSLERSGSPSSRRVSRVPVS